MNSTSLLCSSSKKFNLFLSQALPRNFNIFHILCAFHQEDPNCEFNLELSNQAVKKSVMDLAKSLA